MNTPARRLEATFLATTKRRPQAVLVHHRDRDWTYEEIARRAGTVAFWLSQAGVGREARVVLQLPNGPEYVIAYYAILLAGGTVVAINPAATADEVVFVLQHSEASALCAPPGKILEESVSRAPGLQAVLVAGDGTPRISDRSPLPHWGRSVMGGPRSPRCPPRTCRTSRRSSIPRARRASPRE